MSIIEMGTFESAKILTKVKEKYIENIRKFIKTLKFCDTWVRVDLIEKMALACAEDAMKEFLIDEIYFYRDGKNVKEVVKENIFNDIAMPRHYG